MRHRTWQAMLLTFCRRLAILHSQLLDSSSLRACQQAKTQEVTNYADLCMCCGPLQHTTAQTVVANGPACIVHSRLSANGALPSDDSSRSCSSKNETAHLLASKICTVHLPFARLCGARHSLVTLTHMHLCGCFVGPRRAMFADTLSHVQDASTLTFTTQASVVDFSVWSKRCNSCLELLSTMLHSVQTHSTLQHHIKSRPTALQGIGSSFRGCKTSVRLPTVLLSHITGVPAAPATNTGRHRSSAQLQQRVVPSSDGSSTPDELTELAGRVLRHGNGVAR